MKKIYLLLSLGFPIFVCGQTIMQSDLPVAGTAFIMANDSNYTAPVPPGGTGQTWNFAGLQNNYVDTTGFMSSAGTPYAVSFPGSNLAAHDLTDDSYQYFTSSSSGLYFDGFASIDGNFVYNPSQLFIPVPFSFGDSRSNTARVQVDSTITDSTGTTNLRLVLQTESQFDADGSGTLIIPTGTYPNVLRIKSTQVVYDSLLIDLGLGIYVPFSTSIEQTVNYQYVTSGLPNNYLLGIEADSTGTTSLTSQYFLSMATSVPVLESRDKNLPYPNPAFNSLNFKTLTSFSEINVYDINGKKVLHKAMNSDQSLNVEALKNGSYIYEIIQEGRTQKGNFVIQR
jgi:hypothetical protein